MRGLPVTDSNFGLTHADLQAANLHVLTSGNATDAADGVAEVAAFDFDDACYHFYAHDVAVAVTQLRKTALEGSIPGDSSSSSESLEQEFIESYASRRSLSQDELRQLHDWLPRLVRYRASLIICWASREMATGKLTGPVAEQWFANSLPVYQNMVLQTKAGCTVTN